MTRWISAPQPSRAHMVMLWFCVGAFALYPFGSCRRLLPPGAAASVGVQEIRCGASLALSGRGARLERLAGSTRSRASSENPIAARHRDRR